MLCFEISTPSPFLPPLECKFQNKTGTEPFILKYPAPRYVENTFSSSSEELRHFSKISLRPRECYSALQFQQNLLSGKNLTLPREKTKMIHRTITNTTQFPSNLSDIHSTKWRWEERRTKEIYIRSRAKSFESPITSSEECHPCSVNPRIRSSSRHPTDDR